jgi:hypothetical protein
MNLKELLNERLSLIRAFDRADSNGDSSDVIDNISAELDDNMQSIDEIMFEFVKESNLTINKLLKGD